MITRIKTLTFAAVVAATSLTTSHAAIIAYEGVDYGVGVDLNLQAQPAQFGSWKAGAAPGITTSADSLSYTNGGTLATTGNKVVGGNWQSTGMGMNLSNSAWASYKVNVDNQYTIPYPGSYSTVIGKDNSTLYVSFLMQSTAGNAAAFGLYTGDTNAEPFSQLTVGTTVHVTAGGAVTLRTASYNPSLTTYDVVPQNTSTASNTVQNNTSLSVAANSVNFYVLKLDFGATDEVSLFLNPAVGGTEGAASSTIVTPVGEELIFSSFATFLGYNTNTNFVDEIRFGTTWEDVTPEVIPEPSAYAIFLGPLALAAVLIHRRRRVP